MSAVVELAQPRKLLPRWSGHGDLTIVIDGAYTYLRADQVEQLAGIPPWGEGETVLPDEWPLDVAGIPFYSMDDAVRKCEQHGTALALEFVTWLREFLAGVDDEALELAHRVVPFVEAFTVSNAAAILDADPAISMGRARLFAHLEQLGWIERSSPAHDWVITRRPHDRDWLVLRPVRVPAPTRSGWRDYPQVHVTAAGIAELRRTLYAVGRGDAAPTETAIEPLF